MADIENKMNIVDVDIEKEMKKSYLFLSVQSTWNRAPYCFHRK